MITSGQSANRKFQKFPEDPEVVKDGFPREDRVLRRPKKRERREEKRWKVWRGFMRSGQLIQSWKNGPHNPRELFEENGEGKLKKKDVSPLPIKSGQ
jgi:hypothetical protein